MNANHLKTMTKPILFLSFLIISATSYAQKINTKKLDTLLESIASSNKFMGSILVLKDGKVIASKNVGYADRSSKTKITRSTKYRVGSITKTYTATMIFQAIDEHKLTLDGTIDRFFPKIQNANKISIRNLLSHKSGIPNFTKSEDYSTYHTTGKTPEELMRIFENSGSNFEPNTRTEYSNSNYVLLSYILEKVYNKPYAEILREKIIQPLKLTQTYFGGKIDLQKHEACSYQLDSVWTKQSETEMTMLTGAGAIVATPREVLKFVDALFNKNLISKSSLAEMKKDFLGLGDFSFENRQSYGHTGHVDGFNCLYGYFPEDNISFIITSNGSGLDNNDIALGLLSIIFNLPYEIPEIFKPTEVQVKK